MDENEHHYQEIIARLEAENTSLSRQKHLRDLQEKEFALERETLESRLNEQCHIAHEADSMKDNFQEMVSETLG